MPLGFGRTRGECDKLLSTFPFSFPFSLGSIDTDPDRDAAAKTSVKEDQSERQSDEHFRAFILNM
jgi:hypothetical protein